MKSEIGERPRKLFLGSRTLITLDTMLTTHLEEQLNRIAELAEDPGAREAACRHLEAAFALVPQTETKDFLPTYALRWTIQHRMLQDISVQARIRVLDWASEAMVAWLAQSDTDLNHPKRDRLNSAVPRRFYRALHRSLQYLQEADPRQELIFRLIQVAGYSAHEVAQMLGESPVAIEGLFIGAQAQISIALEEEQWSLELLDKADIRPPSEVTRLLENAREQNSGLWPALISPKIHDKLRQTARQVVGTIDADSILHESLLKLAMKGGTIPENSDRLRAYIAVVMKRLALDRYRKAGKTEQIEDQDELDRMLNTFMSRPHDRGGIEAGITRVLEQMRRDEPYLFRTVEVLMSPGLGSMADQAEALSVSLATLKRWKRKIREYFSRALQAEGFEVKRYEEFSPQQRQENLYQLIDQILMQKLNLPKGGNYRSELAAALDQLKLSNDSIYDILYRAYLGPSVRPKELARILGITTKDLNELRADAKLKLAKKVAEIWRSGQPVRGGRTTHGTEGQS
jgi:DNA-directed RNA polymerase specialized sigma24 family protein